MEILLQNSIFKILGKRNGEKFEIVELDTNSKLEFEGEMDKF